MVKKFALIVLFVYITSLYASAQSDQLTAKEQSPIIQKIISKENDELKRKELVNIINYIDTTYNDLYENLNNGGKIVIYFGPAHGKDNTGEWQGITTNRVGVTGLPEEYYSIKYSRKFYNLLKKNKYIKIVSQPEYQDVLDGKSESYQNMSFPYLLQCAKEAKAFMVIEMHMNNVSITSKADGLVNMPGIHLARDSRGRKMLINIRGANSGFLTLFNKYDASGFSEKYAVNIRQSLVKKGYIPNGWDYGAVADDRFIFYLNFPISVIYECGFISEPNEEKKLLDPEYMDGMVQSQYDMLLKTLDDMYGIDISGDKIRLSEKDYSKNIELLKLARIAIFYMQEAETSQANSAVCSMRKYFYSGQNEKVINYYSSLMKRINNSESMYNKGLKYKNKKKQSKARNCFIYAKKNLNRNKIFSGYRQKYNEAIYGNRKKSETDDKVELNNDKKADPVVFQKKVQLNETSVIVKKSSITKPVILIIRKKQSLEDAVDDALSPDEENLKLISGSIKSYYGYSYKKVKQYSKTNKKNVYVHQKVPKKYEFCEGIYIVSLDKNRHVVNAERVSKVYLNPDKYQNQQYLKNSYFAETEREKDY